MVVDVVVLAVVVDVVVDVVAGPVVVVVVFGSTGVTVAYAFGSDEILFSKATNSGELDTIEERTWFKLQIVTAGKMTDPSDLT
jgi:hypothetical protein